MAMAEPTNGARLRGGWIESAEAIGAQSDAWDDLWRRSYSGLPSLQAEPLLEWRAMFAPGARFRAAVVEQGDRLVAALPLVGRRCGPFLIDSLPNNDWCVSGDVLWDEAAGEAALEELGRVLAAGLPMLGVFDCVPIEAPRWRRFTEAVERVGLRTLAREHVRVGRVEMATDWARYEASRSKSQRQGLRRAWRRLEESGRLELVRHHDGSPEELDRWVRTGFEVEHRSWKGPAGTSVLSQPGLCEYYQRLARFAAERGQFEICFLELDGRPIAFEYGLIAKECYYSIKVGYDPAWSKFTPGQLLRLAWLQLAHEEKAVRWVDYCGPLTDALAHWSTANYGVGRYVIAPPRATSRAAIGLWRRYGPLRTALAKWLPARKSGEAGMTKKRASIELEPPADQAAKFG